MFAIYTVNNAYLLEAADFDEMKDWVSKIDQFYPVKNLSQ
jgi:kinesin family protein 1